MGNVYGFDLIGGLLVLACVVLVLLPPKWDPAIHLKEWTLRRRGE